MRGAGGTPGGLGTFLAGSAMVVAGGYLLLTRVTVTSGLWQLWGYNAFGLSLVPLLVGIGLLFFIVGFTLGVILPVYRKLLDPGLSARSEEAQRLLRRWGWLHHVRSLAGLAAFLSALLALGRAAG